MEWVVMILMGIFVGWLAGVLVRGRGFGLLGDVLVGVLGAVLGGGLFQLLGLVPETLLGVLITALVGAVILVGLVRLFKKM